MTWIVYAVAVTVGDILYLTFVEPGLIWDRRRGTRRLAIEPGTLPLLVFLLLSPVASCIAVVVIAARILDKFWR